MRVQFMMRIFQMATKGSCSTMWLASVQGDSPYIMQSRFNFQAIMVSCIHQSFQVCTSDLMVAISTCSPLPPHVCLLYAAGRLEPLSKDPPAYSQRWTSHRGMT